MNAEFDEIELEQLIVDRLRENDGNTVILFNGHFGVEGHATLFSNSPMYQHEAKVNQVYMVHRTNKYFVDWYNLRYLIGNNGPITPEVVKAWKDRQQTEWISVANQDCHECGKRLDTYFNGVSFMFAEASNMKNATSDVDPILRCRFDGGLKEYSVDICVPSGRLVFANDFRNMMPVTPDDHYVNYAVGIYDTVLDAAGQGFLTAFVGNTCPSIIQDGNTLVVGNQGYDDDDKVVDPINGTEAGSICTDLWWFYAMDGDVYENSTCEYKPAIEVDVKVAPGCYRMTIHERNNGDYVPEVSERFATISLLHPK